MQRITMLVLTILVGGVSSLAADEVFLTNGDRLSGTITQLADGKLTIATTLAGDITVEVTSVGTLSTAAPVVMRFRDGTTGTGLVQDAAAGQIFLTDAGGQILRTLALADVATLHPPHPPTVWSGNVRAGLTFTRGNSAGIVRPRRPISASACNAVPSGTAPRLRASICSDGKKTGYRRTEHHAGPMVRRVEIRLFCHEEAVSLRCAAGRARSGRRSRSATYCRVGPWLPVV